jgi:hypothetical protein
VRLGAALNAFRPMPKQEGLAEDQTQPVLVDSSGGPGSVRGEWSRWSPPGRRGRKAERALTEDALPLPGDPSPLDSSARTDPAF